MDKTNLTAMLITTLIDLAFLSGVWAIYGEAIRRRWAKLRMRNRLKARKKALKPESALERHLGRVLSIALKKPIGPKSFLRCTGAAFLLVLLAGLQTAAPGSALLMAALIASMPYLFLRVRVETIRRKSSYEGEKLMAEFLCQYRISGLNIYRTMEQVILVSQGTKITSKLLFKLLLELRNTGNPLVIREATDRFAYGINTGWSRMLANCIRISAGNGTNVTLALEDIQLQLQEARQLYEERRRLNSESARMVVFLAPLLYLGTFVMSVHYLGIPLGKLVQNQFHTEQGFLMLLIIVFLFFINLALIEIINNQRFDY